jgi:hypothetical protein
MNLKSQKNSILKHYSFSSKEHNKEDKDDEENEKKLNLELDAEDKIVEETMTNTMYNKYVGHITKDDI